MTTPPTLAGARTAWDAIADGFDRYTTTTTTAFSDQLLDRVELGTGVRVLDVAAGSGATAIPAARRGAEILAVDIAPTMIDRLQARARQEGLSQLEGRVMDGQALELGDDQFDVAVSMNGVSSFPDLPRGMQEMVRVTRPGGNVLVAAFGPVADTEFIGWYFGALRAAVPGFTPPPADSPLPPFRLADPDVFRRALTEAGARDVQVDTVTWDMAFESARHLWHFVIHSDPNVAQLAAPLADAQVDDVQRVLDGMLRERSGGTPNAVLQTRMNIGLGIG